MSAGKIAIGVLTGVAVGALLGILFAPDKGSETRKKLSRKGNDLVEDVKDTLDMRGSKSNNQASSGNRRKESNVEMG